MLTLNTSLELLHLHSVLENPAKHISHIQVLVTDFFPTPPIKLKLELQVGKSKSNILSIGGDVITKTSIMKTSIRKPQSRQ
jgi:hypothetical protein